MDGYQVALVAVLVVGGLIALALGSLFLIPALAVVFGIIQAI